MSGSRGQASVELVVAAPLVLLAALVLVQVLAGVRCALEAERAAQRARNAALAGRDPRAAARRGLPRSARVVLDGTRLCIAVPVPDALPLALPLPAATAEVDLGERGGAQTSTASCSTSVA